MKTHLYYCFEFKTTSIRKAKKAAKYQRSADVLASCSMRWLANAAQNTKWCRRHCKEYDEYLKSKGHLFTPLNG